MKEKIISHTRSASIALKNYFQFIFILLVVVGSACTKEYVTGGGGSANGGAGTFFERIILDTAYGTDPKQKMDIYLPAGRTSATKTIILIHGGGWEAGDKNEMNYYKNLLRAKWPEAAIVNINYRLASNSANIHYNEIMNDITSAVNLIVSNKASFAISDTITMLGASAGAHLAMLYTYKYNSGNYVKCVADFFGPAVLNDWSWYNSFNIWLGKAVKDVLSQYNNSPWDLTLYQANSPYSAATAQSKPSIIFHGTVDLIVPLYQSQWLHARLNTLGVVNEYYEYFDGHGFNNTNTDDCMNKVVLFFKHHLQ